MTKAMSEFQGRIQLAFTAVKGKTRKNVTLVDTK